MSEKEIEKPKLALGIVGGLAAVALITLILPGVIKNIGSAEDRPNQRAETGIEEQQAPDSAVESAAIEGLEIEGSEIEGSAAASDGSGLVSTPTPTPVAETPWADARRKQARTDTQNTLSELLKQIQALKSLRAQEWAPDKLNGIQELAEQGDAQYEVMSYEAAIEIYDQALVKAQLVIESAPEAAQKFVVDGTAALEKNQLNAAVTKLELATLLNPDSQEASELLNRAKVREEAMMLDSAAENFLRENALENALEKYLATQALDAKYADIDQKIESVQQLIIDRDYQQAMSLGFKHLSDGKLNAAESAFKKAGTIKQVGNVVEQALQQVESARINNARQVQLDRAVGLEAEEKWAQALSIYAKLLREDSTLTSASLGKIRSEVRANLDDRIQTILADPLKLQNDGDWKNANIVLTDARNITNRGSKLQSQIDSLEMIVRRARTKVTLALSSDSQTNVEIYRLGNLGQFSEHAVSLFPGRYVVVGKRSGCRDVREDLVIDGTQPRIELNIQCRETI